MNKGFEKISKTDLIEENPIDLKQSGLGIKPSAQGKFRPGGWKLNPKVFKNEQK